MPYLIDGHNLIPRLGLSLQSPDDEQELIARLQEFSRRERTLVEVYFDGAPPGQAGSRKYGTVLAHFVRQGLTADEAIAYRLTSLGAQAKNWTIVSSDHQVQKFARRHHARVVSAEEFARLLRSRPISGQNEKPDGVGNLEEWLEMFRERRKK